MAPASLAPIAAAALLGLCVAAAASVHDYAGDTFVSRSNALVLHGGSEGLFAGDSFIRFEKITFTRPKESAPTSNATGTAAAVRAVVFEAADRDTVGGSAYGGQKALCCTTDLARIGACTEGALIHRPSNHSREWPRVFTATFHAGATEAAMPAQTIWITRTGMYNLYFVVCDPTLEGLVIKGKTVWKNPSGYLPGSMAPLMFFHGFMSLAFVALGLYWFYQYTKFWKEVMPLQNCITLVITLGMFETALWYFDLAEFNKSGVRPAGTTIWAASFGTVRRTVSRVLILLVSMGYGVVRPTLGGLSSKVLILGGASFLASEVLEAVENVGIVSDRSPRARLFFVVPVAVIDAFFVIWILASLSRTLNKLQARRMAAKLEIYRKFTIALVASVVASLVWIVFEIYFKSTDVYNEQWQLAWIIPALWQLISFSVLCVICTLWPPSHNSMRFAYSDDGSEDFDQEDTHQLIRAAGPFSYKDSWSYSISSDAKMILKVNAAAPGDSDPEEDKRE